MFGYALPFVMLWLFLLDGVGFAFAVCTHCFGNVEGCSGDTANCPLVTTTAANVTALVAATTITVAAILPSKVIRVFPRTVLDTLSAIVTAPKNGVAYDFTGKTAKDIFTAVVRGHTTASLALGALNQLLFAADEEVDVNKISKTMDTIKSMDKAKSFVPVKGGATDGALMYIWAMTEKCVEESSSIVLKAEGEKESSQTSFTAKLGRPGTLSEFVSRLNFWVMVCHATGAANVLMSLPFLEEVVHSLLRKGLDWKVVHELFLIYIEAVEATSKYNLGNIFETGGQDTKMKEAEANVAKYFRGRGGDPHNKGEKKLPWDCAFDSKATTCCTSYNLCNHHPTNAIGADGRCRYLHECDKFLVDADGKKIGTCGSRAHPRVKCDNPKRMGH
jgi:hypothetical protein